MFVIQSYGSLNFKILIMVCNIYDTSYENDKAK